MTCQVVQSPDDDGRSRLVPDPVVQARLSGEEFSADCLVDDDGEPELEALEDRSRVRVFLTRGQVLAFCEQADSLVAAGRPPFMWCSLPIDPDGHICPRMN